MKHLYLDLGNTRLKYWLCEDGKPTDHMALGHLQSPAELLIGLEDRFQAFAPDFVGISSVLGETLNERVAHQLGKRKVDFAFVTVDTEHQLMRSAYDSNQLGVDRWLQMLGIADSARKLCVVGCGTALTIDLIDCGQHLGGYILPSIYLQRESLQSGTRQIRIPDGQFASIEVGTSTTDAVHRGILLSLVGAVEQALKPCSDFELIMTGGDASKIAQHLSRPASIEDNLLLKGMQRYFSQR